jgi:glucosamine-6-phosphate deaminase
MKDNPQSFKRSLELHILPNRQEMGKAAAREVSFAMKRIIEDKGEVTMAFAAAPSQNEFLAHLSKTKHIDWAKVICFHLDDYVELPRFHPNTFEAYLKEHLFDQVRPQAVHFMKALQGEGEQVARQYAALIRQCGGLDIVCLGIGENGHIAFNEPGSKTDDSEMVRLITIDSRSVRQQYRDYKDHPNFQARYPRASEGGRDEEDVGGAGIVRLSFVRAETAPLRENLSGSGFRRQVAIALFF